MPCSLIAFSLELRFRRLILIFNSFLNVGGNGGLVVLVENNFRTSLMPYLFLYFSRLFFISLMSRIVLYFLTLEWNLVMSLQFILDTNKCL